CSLILPLFSDPYPRARYAACQCVYVLFLTLRFSPSGVHQQLFSVLIPTLEAPESRVHAHAAAALINFCEGVERDTLIPYLGPIVERLLKLLIPAGFSPANADANGAGNENGTGVKRYMQEQVITTLAMVADASEDAFAKVNFSLFRFASVVEVVGWSCVVDVVFFSRVGWRCAWLDGSWSK
ncbi:uncharacterized protein STEHIDRAFT_69909, partial [Stereum hirsutum FP-91666 SS1]